MITNTYITGTTVMTRRGKQGTVEGYNVDGTVNVRFGSRVFPMRDAQLVSVRAYARTSQGAGGIRYEIDAT